MDEFFHQQKKNYNRIDNPPYLVSTKYMETKKQTGTNVLKKVSNQTNLDKIVEHILNLYIQITIIKYDSNQKPNRYPNYVKPPQTTLNLSIRSLKQLKGKHLLLSQLK